MSQSVAMDCISQVEAVLKAIPTFSTRAWQVYSAEELLDRTKGVSLPAFGVVYDGIVAPEETGRDTQKVGASGNLSVSVLFLFQTAGNSAKEDSKIYAAHVLDSIRQAMRGVRAPTGHVWRFKMESLFSSKGNLVTYIQRWGTPIQLV